MAYTIRKMGHTVDKASGGRQGVSLFRPGETDFVITDLKMDDLDGLGVIKAIKEQEPNVLVMVVTAFGTIEVAVDAMKAGAYDFITKPFSMELLRAKVEKAVQARELENVMEQALVLAEGETLVPDDLPMHISQKKPVAPPSGDTLFSNLGDMSLPQLLDDIESQLIKQAFDNANGVKTETARILGINTSALYYKLNKYHIGT
jgi:DNA-binding NtrC family response regulator